MRKRIIVIDPIGKNVALYIRMLQQGGLKVFDVINASSLEEAKLFLTLQPINLIIINSKYVDESQSEIYQQALRYHPAVKFVFLHSQPQKEHVELPQNSYYSNERAVMMLLRKASVCLV